LIYQLNDACLTYSIANYSKLFLSLYLVEISLKEHS
jgi:hypothetical protein